MLIDQVVKLKMYGKYIKYFRELGYTFDFNDIIDVPISDLPLNSCTEVNVICDYCGKTYTKRFKHTGYVTKNDDCCNDCKNIKTRETCMEKYGAVSNLCLEETKEKRLATNLERYGDEYPGARLPEFKEKHKNTMIGKYGVEYPLQSDYFKQKVKNTLLERYGVENIFYLAEIRERIEKTCIEKYGVPSPFGSIEIRKKIEETNLLKYGCKNPLGNEEVRNKRKITLQKHYGVNHPMSSEEIQNKVKRTNMERYGVEYAAQSPDIMEKVRNTNIIRYGFPCTLSSPIIREKVNQTMYKNGTCKTSSQQIELHKMIQERYPNAILNYPLDKCTSDVALFIEDKNIKIDIEYDCWYWHQNTQKDRRRDYFFYSKGWKVLRVKSAKKLPMIDELFDAIDYLINTEHHHKCIVLDDWQEPNNTEIA